MSSSVSHATIIEEIEFSNGDATYDTEQSQQLQLQKVSVG